MKSKGNSARGSAAVTLKDVARVAGVSAQTVSCVVNNNGSVSEKVRKRIHRIADRLGYRTNNSARAMRTGRSQTIGLVISDICQPFYPELANSIERAAADAGYAILLADAHGSPEEARERIGTLKSHRVDGVIACVSVALIGRLGLPTVTIGDPVRGIDSITSDDVQGGTLLAEHIIAQGHRTIGLVTSPKGGDCIPVRRNAFVKQFGRIGNIAWEVYTPHSEVITPEVRSVIERGGVTAIVCSDDLIAIGAMRALREMNRQIPSELSVVGYDDIPWAAIVTPALTTIRQPFLGLGKGAVELLLDRIANPARRCRHIKLGVSLVERESVANLIVLNHAVSGKRAFSDAENFAV